MNVGGAVVNGNDVYHCQELTACGSDTYVDFVRSRGIRFCLFVFVLFCLFVAVVLLCLLVVVVCLFSCSHSSLRNVLRKQTKNKTKQNELHGMTFPFLSDRNPLFLSTEV